MIEFFETAAARLADPVRCPAVLQAHTAMDPNEFLNSLALGVDVTAIVSPLSEEAEPVKSLALQVTQKEVWTFGVTMALVFPGGFAQWGTARRQIKAALRGWTPEGASGPVEYRGASNLRYDAQEGGSWIYLLRFSVPVHETYGAQS